MYTLSAERERGLLWLLALTQFTLIIDFMVIMPLGPQVMQAFRISPPEFATAVSAYSWCSGLSGLLAATYIDRFDRRRLLLAVYALFALSNAACACAGSFPLLLAARAFAGITGGVLGALIMAIIADVIPLARRGAATGTVMTAFSIAAIAGVPAGVLLGAHLGWAAPFWVLAALSVLIWFACSRIVPPLADHLVERPTPLAQVVPRLWRLVTNPHHVNAYALMFLTMLSNMTVIPFISPMLVANHGVPPTHLSWMYMAGGAATFFTSRAIGRLADRLGRHLVFRLFALLSVPAVLLITHLPNAPYAVLLTLFAVCMVMMSARTVPMQAIITTVPAAPERGAFLSASSAVQALASGSGAWLGGLWLSTSGSGQLLGYGINGWVAVMLIAIATAWVGRVTATTQAELRNGAPTGTGPA